MRGVTSQMMDTSSTNAISIHTPHAGSDDGHPVSRVCHLVFQSTLPMRGVTFASSWAVLSESFQSTLPMRGVTSLYVIDKKFHGISIHTPHAGSDDDPGHHVRHIDDFNPHSPCGE